MTTATRKHTNGLRIAVGGTKAHRKYRVETTTGRALTTWTNQAVCQSIIKRRSA